MATPWTVFRETTRFHVPAKGGGRYDPAHIRIHKIVVGVGLACGALGVLAALGFAAGSVIVALSAKNLESAAVTLIGIPVSFLIPPGCYFIGTSMALVFAPTRFLRGPIGQKWVKIAGVKSPILARLLFILIVVLVVGIVVAIVVTLMHLP